MVYQSKIKVRNSVYIELGKSMIDLSWEQHLVSIVN